jgi:RNA-binding protein
LYSLAGNKEIVLQKLKGSEKKYLRGLAHGLSPIVFIGKQGLSDTVISDIKRALNDHELIKIKFIDYKDKKKEILSEIEKTTESRCAGNIGNVVVLYLEQDDPEKRKIKLP